MTYEQWIENIKALIKDGYDMHLRRGQFYFNKLKETKFELAHFLQGTKVDPFYEDDRLEEFLKIVKVKWNKEF